MLQGIKHRHDREEGITGESTPKSICLTTSDIFLDTWDTYLMLSFLVATLIKFKVHKHYNTIMWPNGYSEI